MRGVMASIGGLAIATRAGDARDEPAADDDPPPADLRIGYVVPRLDAEDDAAEIDDDDEARPEPAVEEAP